MISPSHLIAASATRRAVSAANEAIALWARYRRRLRPYVRIRMYGTKHTVTKPVMKNLIACNSNEAGR